MYGDLYIGRNGYDMIQPCDSDQTGDLLQSQCATGPLISAALVPQNLGRNSSICWQLIIFPNHNKCGSLAR